MKTTRASSTYHEWLVDVLEARGTKTTVEGSDTAYSDITAPTRKANYVQQMEVTWQISDMAIATTHAGMKDLLVYEITRAAKVFKNSLEYDAFQSTSASGSEGVKATMTGAMAFVTTNSTDNATAALTESIYNDMCQTIWEAGGDPSETFVGGYLKRVISSFTANSTRRNIDAEDKRLVNAIDIYSSDFGVQKIYLSRDINSGADDADVLISDPAMWKMAWLINPHKEDRAKTKSATNGVICGAATLVCLQEKACGKIINCATS